MNLSVLFPVTGLPTAQPAGKVKAEKAAQDFEAILLGSLLESLQKSFAGPSEDAPVGSDSYAAMGTQALASAMSAPRRHRNRADDFAPVAANESTRIERAGGSPRNLKLFTASPIFYSALGVCRRLPP